MPRKSVVVFSSFVGILCGGALGTVACGPTGPDPLPDGCFPDEPWAQSWWDAYDFLEGPDFKVDPYFTMLRNIGFCEYGPQEVRDAFGVVDDNTDPRAHIDRMLLCYEPEEGGLCASCPELDMERELKDELRRRQDELECADGREILEFELGCVGLLPRGDEGTPKCCYSALIVSECPVINIEVTGGD